MKRMILLLLCACLVLGLCACQKAAPAQSEPSVQGPPLPITPQNSDPAPADTSPLAPTQDAAVQAPPTKVTPSEYVLYMNIFYNETGDDYVGQTFQKIGTLARVRDAFNGRTRWYVWGYKDQTKCCDWQWEFVPKDEASLPDVGSLVEVSGTFAASENALDGFWLEDADVTEKTAYAAPQADCALTVMSDTLERVQILNMQYYADEFEGKTVWAYGRISGPGELQDPYYDGSWTQKFNSSDELPPIGTTVILQGTWRGGVIDDCSVTPTEDY